MQTVFSPGRAFQASRSNGVTSLPSSFGPDLTTQGGSIRAQELITSERAIELAYRESFYRCSNHDNKMYDFNGRMIKPGRVGITQQFLGATQPSVYVPLDQRRPSAPYRLPRVIVNSFTGMTFGHGRWPKIRVIGDPKTQDFAEALVKVQRLPTLMITARNLGGSCGSVGLAWSFHHGRPRTTLHNAKSIFIHAWLDKEDNEPEHVSEIYQYPKDEWDPEKRSYVRNFYWHRRDWTTYADIIYDDVLVVPKEEPPWSIKEAIVHDDGFCHFVWIKNLAEEGDDAIDGQPDYAEQYENFGTMDVLNSVVTRGGILNLDPTLKLKMDPEIVKRHGIRKGSDNAIVTGLDGDASYMEIGGQGITAGNELCEKERKQILEVAQCVSPNPDTMAAAGSSSVALKMIYAPMLSKCDILRDNYGDGILKLLRQQIASARKRMLDEDGLPLVAIEIDDDGIERRAVRVLSLPPRVTSKEVFDAEGNPTGETEEVLEDRYPGKGGDLELEWGPYFKDTEDDKQKRVATLATAAGSKLMAEKSAVELTAAAYGLDPHEEWQNLADQKAADSAAQAAMFPGYGGEVGDMNELPPGAAPAEEPAAEEAPKGEQPNPDVTVPANTLEISPSMITGAMQIVQAVAQGALPRDSAIGIFQALYGFDKPRAALLLGSAGTPTPTQANPVMQGAPEEVVPGAEEAVPPPGGTTPAPPPPGAPPAAPQGETGIFTAPGERPPSEAPGDPLAMFVPGEDRPEERKG